MRGCWGAVPTTRPDPSFQSYEFAWFSFNHEAGEEVPCIIAQLIFFSHNSSNRPV